MLRPSDADALRGSLRSIRADVGVPILFGGSVQEETLTLTEFFGTRTSGLRRLKVRSGSGLGGRCMALGQIVSVSDYERAAITHDYDEPVLAEGIRTVVAAPVVVSGTTRMVVYAASRDGSLGSSALNTVATTARKLSQELRIRDEVDRRVELMHEQLEAREASLARTVREVNDVLLQAIGSVQDAGFRRRLEGLSGRLMTTDSPRISLLSPRETEVLALVSLGSTYAEAAAHLSIRPETVKSYMRNTMAKLGVSNRHRAVVEARTRNLLP